MRPPERGATPAGFRRQLLQQLRNEALRTGVPALRLQHRIAFEQLLARLSPDDNWVLKGGFALEFRYGLQTRSTKDIDLRTPHEAADALDRLRNAVAVVAAEDNFSFEFGDVARELQGAPGGSLRVRVVALVASQQFVTFHVDISSGDAIVDRPELLRGSNLLEFAGIATITFPVYPVAQHLAEKLHAYTLRRSRENTRVRDLVDLAIIAGNEKVDADRLQQAVEATFVARGTHALPGHLAEPPGSGEQPFRIIASQAKTLDTAALGDGYALAAGFWDPFLARDVAHHVWLPALRHWVPLRGADRSSAREP